MNRTVAEKKIKTLFDQYFVGLVDFSFNFVKCRETALDLVQDTFVKLLEISEKLPTHERALKSYLYSTVRNVSLNHIRHQKVTDEYHKSKIWTEQDEEQILAALIEAETVNNLYRAIETLPKACQEVCRLTYLEGKSNQEVAELCGVSINTIKKQKSRSIKLLRHRLIP